MALLACLSAHAAEARPGRPTDPNPVPAVRQAIVQKDAVFIIMPVVAPIAPNSARERNLVPIGGAVRIDRDILEDISTGKVTNDAQI